MSGKRRFKHRPDGLEQPERLGVEVGLLVPGEPEVYSTEYLTRLNHIATPDDQRKYDDGNIL